MLRTADRLIVEGWLAGIMASKLPGVLRILLTCEEKTRVRRFAKRGGITVEEAKQQIDKRESNLFARLKQIYGRNDIIKKMNYNFVLDTTKLTEEEVVQKVLNKLGKSTNKYR